MYMQNNDLCDDNCIHFSKNSIIKSCNITPIQNTKKIIYLFEKGIILKWKIIPSDFTNETYEQIRNEMNEAIINMHLEHLFEEVLESGAQAHITIRVAASDMFYALSQNPPNNGDLCLTRYWKTLCKKGRIQVLQHEIRNILGCYHEIFLKTKFNTFQQIFEENEDNQTLLKMFSIDYSDDMITANLPEEYTLKRFSPHQINYIV